MTSSWLKKANNQHIIDELSITVHDVDRYRTDLFEVYVSILKGTNSVDIGFHINNAQLGVASYIEYWHYKPEEEALARRVFQQIKTSTQDVVNKIETERVPFSLYGPMLRSSLRHIDPDHKDISGIYSYNKSIKQELESDWRSSIYGNRYPKTPEIGNSKEGFFAEQPTNKEINIKGSGRNAQFTYKN